MVGNIVVDLESVPAGPPLPVEEPRGSQIIVPSSLSSMCSQLESWLNDFRSGSHCPGQAGEASLQGVDPPTKDQLPWVFAQ